jgi:hypothetical protein
MSGAVQFARFALPPNAYGYCGPADLNLVAELVAAGDVAVDEMRAVAQQFEGAWPYLQFISDSSGADPLSAQVVEAYWIGSNLLRDIDTLAWGNSVEDRFRPRAGDRWRVLSDGIVGGVPNHAFHVFCVYPWVGLLRAGYTDHALEVIDQCRIRWGTVVEVVGTDVLVRSAPLTWDGRMMHHGAERIETVRLPLDDQGEMSRGDVVALHWDYVCQVLSPRQHEHLVRYHDRHLAIANHGSDSLASLIET